MATKKHYRVSFIGKDGVPYHTFALASSERAAAKSVAANPPLPGVREVVRVIEMTASRPPTKASVARARAVEARRRAAARASAPAAPAPTEKLTAEEEFERRFGLDQSRPRRSRRR